MAMGLIFCGSICVIKRNPMNYSEFTKFTYPPLFKDGYQVENATINVDRNDYDKPKKAN